MQPQGSTAVVPVFLTPAVSAAGLTYKIHVTNSGPASETGSVTTYGIKGNKTKPTITKGLDYPVGVAVDRHGKICVTSYLTNTLATYNPDGTGTPPTITTGLDHPVGVKVDAAGKIYVANLEGGARGSGYVSTYKPDGTRTTPTIVLGIDEAWGVAVDTKGKDLRHELWRRQRDDLHLEGKADHSNDHHREK